MAQSMRISLMRTPAKHSRTIEPSVTDGGRYYNLLASCIRVLRVQHALGIHSNGTGCDVVGEDCCEQRANESFAIVYSLDSPGRATSRDPDSIATSNATLALQLQDAGWKQICSADPTAMDGTTTLVVRTAAAILVALLRLPATAYLCSAQTAACSG